ncbi:MAG: hypothetical protein ACSHX6_08350 [Akkermansiaceae bacterium]
MNYSRRQFQLVSLTAAASAAFSTISTAATEIEEVEQLKRRDVQAGLQRGINFTGAVREILAYVQQYSIEQTLLGGCVLSLAAEQTADSVHILIMADPIKVATAMANTSIEGMESINGNSLAFEYNGQQFFIEHLSEELYNKRLENLVPGSSDNDFYIEYAHQLLTYNVQSRRHRDAHGAIGNSSDIELKRVNPAKDSSSVVKTMVESSRLGIALPRDEQNIIDDTLSNGLQNSENSVAATENFLSQLSQFTQYHDEKNTSRLLNSKLAEDTLGDILGCDTKKLDRTFYKIKRKTQRNTPHSEIWLSAIQCLENTEESHCNEALTLLHNSQSGYSLLKTKQDTQNSSKLIELKGVNNLHIKIDRRGH